MTMPAEKSMSLLSTRYEPLLLRHPANPILTSKDWPYPINSVFNAGATLLADGSTLLLCRVEDRRGLSHLCAARSINGVDGWQIDSEPTLMPSPKDFPEEIWGIEDPRITFVPELQQYVVTYTSYSRGGPGVSLALTKDFRIFERYGVIMPPDDKDSALLPRRINGYWALIHRPATSLGAHIWISYSPDLRHWGTAQAHTGSPPRSVVGRKQDRFVAAAHRDFQGMACALSRSSAYALGLSVSLGPGPFELGESGKVPTARGFVDFWSGGGIRVPRRCRRCRIPLRLHNGSRWRHHQHLLRSCGLRDCPGAGQRALSTQLARCQWKLRAPTAGTGLMKQSAIAACDLS